jgi:phage terminase large subunit-like protein
MTVAVMREPETALFTLSGPQADVFESPVRFRVLVAGRRFGKTHLAVVELITKASEHQGSRNWYIAPTYRQAKQVAWYDLKRLCPTALIADKNETELTLWLKNGSEIALRGADNPDSLRGGLKCSDRRSRTGKGRRCSSRHRRASTGCMTCT